MGRWPPQAAACGDRVRRSVQSAYVLSKQLSRREPLGARIGSLTNPWQIFAPRGKRGGHKSYPPIDLIGQNLRSGCPHAAKQRQGGGDEGALPCAWLGVPARANARASPVFHRAITLMPWFRDLELARHGVKYIEPDFNVAMLLKDGRTLEWHKGLEQTVASFSQFSKKDGESLRRWVDTFVPIVEQIL